MNNNYDYEISEILSIEDTAEIAYYQVPKYGFLLWPYIRFNFLNNIFTSNFLNVSLQQKEICKKSIFTTVKNKISGYIASSKIFFPYLYSLLSPWPHRDIWYLSNIGREYYKIYMDNYIDIYNDLYASLFPDRSLYIATSFTASKILRKNNYPYKFIKSATFLFDKFYKYAITHQHKKIVCEFIFFLQERIKKCLPDIYNNINFSYYKECLLWYIGYSILQHKFYQILFRHTKPKALILTDSYYGGQQHIVKLAKDYNIITIELQHGFISPSHFAYNWTDTLCNNTAVIEQSVDYFLTYGDLWKTRTHLPGKQLAIGNAFFSIRNAQCRGKGKEILFVLEEYDTSLNDLITFLASKLPERKIYVRPHPSFRKEFINNAINIPGTIIDKSLDIYETFEHVDIVIGTESTALIEALALGKRVFRLSTTSAVEKKYADFNIQHFSSAHELLALIRSPNHGRATYDFQKSIFDTNWQSNYKKFINTIVLHKAL